MDHSTQHEAAGGFSLVPEHVQHKHGETVTDTIDVPTIGIHVGPHWDGQVLVVDEVVGLAEVTAPFFRSFGDVRPEMADAIEGYLGAVERGEFPADEHNHYENGIDEIY